MKKGLLIALGVLALVVIIVISIVGWGVKKYNGFVALIPAATPL